MRLYSLKSPSLIIFSNSYILTALLTLIDDDSNVCISSGSSNVYRRVFRMLPSAFRYHLQRVRLMADELKDVLKHENAKTRLLRIINKKRLAKTKGDIPVTWNQTKTTNIYFGLFSWNSIFFRTNVHVAGQEIYANFESKFEASGSW